MKRLASLRWCGAVGGRRLAFAGCRQEPFASICVDLRSIFPIFRLKRGFSDPKHEPQRPAARKRAADNRSRGQNAFKTAFPARFSKKYSHKGTKSAKRRVALQKLLRDLASWREAVFGSSPIVIGFRAFRSRNISHTKAQRLQAAYDPSKASSRLGVLV